MEAPTNTESYRPIAEFGTEPRASELVGRMLVIVYDRHHRDYLVQGYIKQIWVDPSEPRTLRIDLVDRMRYIPDPFDTSIGIWRYDTHRTCSFILRDTGPRAISVNHDPVIDEITLFFLEEGLKLRITSPDTNHPKPDEILPADPSW